MLKTLPDDTSEELSQVRQLNTALEPLMVLFIGVVVGCVLIAMYLPMFKLGRVIQRLQYYALVEELSIES